MTVTNSVNKNTYTGNGVTTQWPYTFDIFNTSDIQVILTDITTGEDTVLTTNFSVNSSSSAPYVIYPVSGTPLTDTSKITLSRSVPITQETALPNQGPYFAKTVEKALDKVTVITQQIQESSGRTLQLSASTDSEVSGSLPSPVPGEYFCWDEEGKKIVNAVGLTSNGIDGGNARSVYLDFQKYDGGGANG